MTSPSLLPFIQLVNLKHDAFYSTVDIIGQKMTSSWMLPKSTKIVIFLMSVKENITFDIISAMLDISEDSAKEAFLEVLEAINDITLPNKWTENPLIYTWQINSKRPGFCLAVIDSMNGLVTFISKIIKDRKKLLERSGFLNYIPKNVRINCFEKCPETMNNFYASQNVIKSMSIYQNDILKAVMFLSNILKT